MENEQATNVEQAENAENTDQITNPNDVEFGGLKIRSSGIFNLYTDISEVAKSLVRDIVRRGYFRESDRKKRKYSTVEGLIMSDEQLQVGALSIGPALSTLFMELKKIKDEDLYSVLNQSALESDDAQKSVKKTTVNDDLTVLDVVKNSILHLLEECYNQDDHTTEIIFEASPFFNESDGSDPTNIDNVRWPRNTETFKIKEKSRQFIDRTCTVGGYLDTVSWVFVVTQLAREFLDRFIPISNEIANKAIEGDASGATEGDTVEQTSRSDILTYDTIWTDASLRLTTSDVRRQLNELYMTSLRFACRCIVYKKGEKNQLSPTGWMFTKGAPTKEQSESGLTKPTFDPDLYMSYAASTIYLGLYKEYAVKIQDKSSSKINGRNVLDELRLLEDFLRVAKRNKKSFETISGKHRIDTRKLDYFKWFKHDTRDVRELREYVDELKENCIKYLPTEEIDKLLNGAIGKNVALKKDIDTVYVEIKEFLDWAESNRSVLSDIEFLFYAINGEHTLTIFDKEDDIWSSDFDRDYTNTPIYTILKEATIASARYFWEGDGGSRCFRKNMALGPCYSDGTLAIEDSYARAGHSNVLFNNLFVIGLIVNSAYDLELLKKDVDEYNDMLQAFQIAVQDTQRRYNLMERNKTIYKVNSFLLEFSEQVDDTAAKIADKLRRVNIAGCYLLPILFKTNGIIEDYLVQYPQREMVQSFKTIIANRKKKKKSDKETKDEYYWVWDKDGYNAISNYYYVDALIAFYRYYHVYEKPFTLSADRIDANSRKNWEKFEALLQQKEEDKKREIERVKEDLTKERIEPLQAELNQYKHWQTSICDFIAGGIAQSLNRSFSLSVEKWIDDKNRKGKYPVEKFNEFVRDPDNSQENLFSSLAWFTKMQLTTMLNSMWTLGQENVDTPDSFRKNLSDKMHDDLGAMSLMQKIVQRSWQETYNEKQSKDDTDK